MDWDHDEFLQVNANVDYMAGRLAQLLRNCMRASLSNDPAAQTHEAVRNFMVLQKLIGFSDGVMAYELFEKAIARIRIEEQRDRVDAAVVRAAQLGLRFLVEKSCYDLAAGGRARRREGEFLQAVRQIEIAQEQSRQEWARQR